MSLISVTGEKSTNSEVLALAALTALATSPAGQAIAKTGPFTFVNVAVGATGASLALDNLASVAINAALVLGTSDAFALGSATKMWSDLFLALGAVINFNNGDVTLTHSAGVLTLSGTLALGTNSITMTGSIGTTGSRLTKGWFTDLQVTNAIAGSVTGNAATATALQNARTIGGVSFDGTGNITVSTATGGFTISGGNLALTTNSITMTGSIAATGARVTKVWTTDLESTNMPTVGGVAMITISSSDVLSNKTLTAPKIATGGFIADANGNELIIFTTTASAVNEWTLANGSTGVNPKLTASGEANVGLDFQAKGSGTYRLLGTATQAAELRLFEDTDDGSNYSAFKVGTQAADITYTLPTAVAGGNGYVLSSTTGGVLSWIAAGAGDMVLNSAQTVTAAKTFNSNTLWDKGNMVFNVKAYGAVGDDSTDDTTSIQNAIAAAGAVGGVVWFPAGTYKITASLKLYNATPTPDVPYSNITLAGAGSSGTLGTIVKQYTTGEDVIKGLNDVTNTVQLLNVTIRDMALSFGGTASNSGNGIYLKQVAAGGPSFQQLTFKNLVITGMGGAAKYGFNAESLIVSTLDNVMCVSCTNGFYLNGSVGSSFGSVSTSVTFLNCYANGCTTNGFNTLQNTYISFVGCAVDFANGATGTGYLIDTSNSISLTGCGTELAGTNTGNLFKITGSSQVGMYNCYGFQNDDTAVLVTGTSLSVTIIGFQNNSDTSTATVGLKVDAGSQVTEIDCDWGTAPNPDTPRSINATGIAYRPGRMRIQSVADAATVTPNSGTDDMVDITAIAQAVTIAAPTGTPENGQKLVIRIKDNATARAITWNSIYVAGGVALPSTTVLSKIMTVGFIYNTANSLNKWQCVAVSQEA